MSGPPRSMNVLEDPSLKRGEIAGLSQQDRAGRSTEVGFDAHDACVDGLRYPGRWRAAASSVGDDGTGEDLPFGATIVPCLLARRIVKMFAPRSSMKKCAS